MRGNQSTAPQVVRTHFAAETLPPHQRMVLVVIGAMVLSGAAAAAFWATVPLPPMPAFLPFYGAIVIVTDLLTAYLLAAQFRITHQIPLLALSGAYLYSGLIVIPHLLVFPGVFSAQGFLDAGPQSAVWMWVLWHGGFPALVLVYAATRARPSLLRCPKDALTRSLSLTQGAVVLGVVALTILVTAGHDLLPPLIVQGSYASLSHSVFAWIVVALNVSALAAVVAATRCRSVAALGLTLAMLASVLDVLLTLHAQSRFSLGWYVARINSVVASGSVLAVFLYEITWLYHRVTDLNESLSRLAFVDELTALANRRQFLERLSAEWARASRSGNSLGLVMIDVDFFKKYNDRYGHPAGDECLKQVARAIDGAVRRPADLAARYGGEEFVVVLPDTDQKGALAVAQAIASAVRAVGLKHESGVEGGIVTVSLGGAVGFPKSGGSPDDLIAAADAALYQAKAQGRNRAVVGGA